MNIFLEKDKLPKITQEVNELIDLYVFKKLNLELIIFPHKTPHSDGFLGKFYQTFKDEITLLFKLFQKIKD